MEVLQAKNRVTELENATDGFKSSLHTAEGG